MSIPIVSNTTNWHKREASQMTYLTFYNKKEKYWNDIQRYSSTHIASWRLQLPINLSFKQAVTNQLEKKAMKFKIVSVQLIMSRWWSCNVRITDKITSNSFKFNKRELKFSNFNLKTLKDTHTCTHNQHIKYILIKMSVENLGLDLMHWSSFPGS